ncbi:peroxiredoxin [Sphingosinicella microcystinivorans]|uniref:peroxiredoxin n=1 Tax=Sphingosinicella microcystinivorans TaxID=335406 RepID=UPI0022F37F07|nr:peroxiredoxin [Sphingosinicella microcystinivorans]WBX86470.1 peroxiredoxin [Sphingosinicella microcystinivorans]
MAKPGSKAPAFTLDSEDGPLSLKDFAGKKLVLYFYPKDDTSGCTREAIDFTGLLPEFEKADTAVLGVSKDTVAKHGKFRAKHGLGVKLGSDPDAKTIEAYGVWVEKTLYGRKYMGIERATFLIGRDGKIAEVWHNVKVPGHAEAVLKAAQALG